MDAGLKILKFSALFDLQNNNELQSGGMPDSKFLKFSARMSKYQFLRTLIRISGFKDTDEDTDFETFSVKTRKRSKQKFRWYRSFKNQLKISAEIFRKSKILVIIEFLRNFVFFQKNQIFGFLLVFFWQNNIKKGLER